MMNFLRSKELKFSVMFAVSGFLTATLGMWIAVAFGVAPIQLPLPSTILSAGILLLAIWGAIIWLGVDTTREVFSNGTPSWGATFLIPLFWVWIVLTGGLLTVLYIGMISLFTGLMVV